MGERTPERQALIDRCVEVFCYFYQTKHFRHGACQMGVEAFMQYMHSSVVVENSFTRHHLDGHLRPTENLNVLTNALTKEEWQEIATRVLTIWALETLDYDNGSIE